MRLSSDFILNLVSSNSAGVTPFLSMDDSTDARAAVASSRRPAEVNTENE